MADNPMLGSRVREEDRSTFKTLAKTHGQTDAELFAEMVAVYKSQATTGSIALPEELGRLQRTLGHVSDIVRGVWAQAADERERYQEDLAARKKAAEDESEQLTAKLTELQIALKAAEDAHRTAQKDAEQAQATVAKLESERAALIKIIDDQSQQLKKLLTSSDTPA